MKNLMKKLNNWLYKEEIEENEKWMETPLLESYMSKYPEFSDVKNKSIKCRFCGSSDIKHKDLPNRNDGYFCGTCNEKLYMEICW